MIMAKIKDIIEKCKLGNLQEAYDIARVDLEANSQNVWEHRKMAWVLYYRIKEAVDKDVFSELTASLEELSLLNMISVANDEMIFTNVLFKVAEYVRKQKSKNDNEVYSRLSTIYSFLRGYVFAPSEAYSNLLRNFIGFVDWSDLLDFFEWWDLDKLRSEDYKQFVTEHNRSLMSLAERAYIANSKALIRRKDKMLIKKFLPRLDVLMQNHSEMVYPGYFYGKLLIATGASRDETLKVLVPFARKKSTEFWVWQLLGEVYNDDSEMQLACLLRAVHCKTKEEFLVKVRTKLARLYITQEKYGYARYQIERVCKCYSLNGWNLPNDIGEWVKQSWIDKVESIGDDLIEYKSVTDNILYSDKHESIAVVTYVDVKSMKVFMVYDHKRTIVQRLNMKVKVGQVLKIGYVSDEEGNIKIVEVKSGELSSDLSYAKIVEGVVSRREGNDYAFLKEHMLSCYIGADLVRGNNLQNRDVIRCLVVYSYNKKKDLWNWVVIKIYKRYINEGKRGK